MFGLAILVALPWWRPADPLTGRVGLLSYAPSGLAQAVRDTARPGDRVVTPQTWASWFEWAAPDPGYFLDSRFELFPAPVWDDYDAIERGGAGAQAVLDRWGVNIVVLPAGAEPLPGAWTTGYTRRRRRRPDPLDAMTVTGTGPVWLRRRQPGVRFDGGSSPTGC